MDEKTTKQIIIDAIAEAVEIVGTQNVLADKSGLSQGAISKYLRGEAKPKGENAKKLEMAVDMKIPRHRFAPHIFDSV